MRRLSPLGRLSPREFMARHLQRRPLLVRGALPPVAAPLSRTELFALAARDDVESRLVRNTARGLLTPGRSPQAGASRCRNYFACLPKNL